MLNTKQQEKIKEVLGSKYSPKIIARLNKKGFLNTRGGAYSKDSIQKIVKGEQDNPAVEMEIVKLVAETIAMKKKIEAAKKAILK